MLSASAEPSDFQGGFAHGARGYMVNPFLSRELPRTAQGLPEASLLERLARKDTRTPPAPLRGRQERITNAEFPAQARRDHSRGASTMLQTSYSGSDSPSSSPDSASSAINAKLSISL